MSLKFKERGPFYVQDGAVYSKDFTLDAGLRVSGDFESPEQKQAYCEWVADVLTKASCAVPEQSPAAQPAERVCEWTPNGIGCYEGCVSVHHVSQVADDDGREIDALPAYCEDCGGRVEVEP